MLVIVNCGNCGYEGVVDFSPSLFYRNLCLCPMCLEHLDTNAVFNGGKAA